MWRLLQCSDTFRLLADCPRVATAVFGLVMAIPALLFLACLHIKFTRVHLHVLRTHLQRCRHLLRPVLTHFRQPVVTSPSSERKNQKSSCEEKLAWSMPGAQTATPSDHEESTNRAPVARPNSMVLAFTLNPGKIGATAVPASFRIRFAQQQTNKASRPPLHGSLSIALHVPVCLTLNRRVQNR